MSDSETVLNISVPYDEPLKKSNQSNRLFFTINNPTDEDIQKLILAGNTNQLSCLSCYRKVGTLKQTLHLQGGLILIYSVHYLQ
jgi:hypothetical protein